MLSHFNFPLRYNPYISTYPTYTMYLLLINQKRDIFSWEEKTYQQENFLLQDFQEKFISKPIKDFETLQFTIIRFFLSHPAFSLCVSVDITIFISVNPEEKIFIILLRFLTVRYKSFFSLFILLGKMK